MPDPVTPKKNFTKSPIFIGICIAIVVVIMVILYYIYTTTSRGSTTTSHGSDTKAREPDELKNAPKLNIKLITNDYEINNLINKINKST
jgi:hypothetical protein